MNKPAEFNWSDEIPYGVAELKKDAATRYSTRSANSLLHAQEVECCIQDCKELLPRRKRTKKEEPKQKSYFCPRHGIGVSTAPTYIYQHAKRNFIIGRDIPGSLTKTESWRLGNEKSEDALSWNVFVSLYVLGGLAEAFKLLTGRDAATEPELYLWGNRICARCAPWEPLLNVRR